MASDGRFIRGQSPWNKGLNKETNSSVMEYANKKIGTKNPMWKGGVDRTIAYKNSEVVKYNKCPRCKKEKRLSVHHVNKNTKDNNPENLMVLCYGCHKKEHLKFYTHKRVKVSCELCKKIVEIIPSRVRKFRFCSAICRGRNTCNIRWGGK